MKQLILASKSPRRKELLERCGIPFITHPADIQETIDLSLPLEKAIQDLALRKAKAVLKDYPKACILGSDTIVVCDKQIMGKPKDKTQAKEMLEKLSGRSHEVITGVAFVSNKKEKTMVSVSYVTFQPISEKEIEDYIQTQEPYDKAGAYAIQGKAGLWIQQIQGDYYSIMGLPLNLVYNELKEIESY